MVANSADMISSKEHIAREFPLVKPYEIGERRRLIDKIPENYVLLKMIVAGICGSDVLYFKGYKEKWKLEKRLPICLLHEGVAEVVETKGETSVKPGDKVVIMPLTACGEYIACKMKLGENLCLNPKFLASTCDGLARTLLVYPASKVIPIPEKLDLRIAVLTEPLSAVLNAIEVSNLSGNEKIAIIGDGTIGYLLASTLSRFFKVQREDLHVIGVVEEKLSIFEDIAEVINVHKEHEKLRELKNRLDIVFEAVGGKAHEKTIDQALDLLRPAGKLVILGIPGEEKTPIRVQKIVSKSLIVKGSFWSRMDHFKKALNLLKDKEFQKMMKRTISGKSFKIREPHDLENALRYADSEAGAASRFPGRILVYLNEA